ncbi:nucleoside triphosphate pyrophosphohydrolase [candidate division KSB1 bacterium]|nr:nucleoside triphosphate pyrophosphohydrolase [candidate division KSB1 bacterium]
MSTKHTTVTENKFQNLIKIMARLRGKDGCPWDKEQTHQSLRQYLLEETFEVLESIDQNDFAALKEELGDLLLQIVFHAQIASEDDRFDINEVIDSIAEKLIRRHPNVFGDVQINSAKEQSINWEKLKKGEGKESVLDGVPKALSALLRAYRLQKKAAAVGFDWPAAAPVWDKIHEEISEFKAVAKTQNQEQIEEEFGDLLFSLVNMSRFIDINPEDALRKATEKFIGRFRKIEEEYAAQDKDMRESSLKELDLVWEKIKAAEKKP